MYLVAHSTNSNVHLYHGKAKVRWLLDIKIEFSHAMDTNEIRLRREVTRT